MLRAVCRKPRMFARAGLIVFPVAAIFSMAPALAHHPDHENMPVHQRVEPIPSWLNNIPSHRERYNRPRYVGGKIAYWIAPSSQEAMSWHRSVHRGYYANHAPRMEDRYFYRKPWQALTVGPRVPLDSVAANNLEAIQNSAPSPAPSPTMGSGVTPNDEADGSIPPAKPFELLPTPTP